MSAKQIAGAVGGVVLAAAIGVGVVSMRKPDPPAGAHFCVCPSYGRSPRFTLEDFARLDGKCPDGKGELKCF